MTAGGVQQSGNGVPPAGGVRAKDLAVELFDGRGGRLVQPARFLVRTLVAEVGTDDDQETVMTPRRFPNFVLRFAQEDYRRGVHDTSQDHVEPPRSTLHPFPEKGPPGRDPGRG